MNLYDRIIIAVFLLLAGAAIVPLLWMLWGCMLLGKCSMFCK